MTKAYLCLKLFRTDADIDSDLVIINQNPNKVVIKIYEMGRTTKETILKYN